MNFIQAIVLGLIQGITEWLPISSSGHLVLFQNLFGLEQPVSFTIILHLSSLLVILIVFRKDILDLIKGVLKLEEKSLKMLIYLAIGSIPIGVAGFLFNDLIKSIFNDLRTIGISLLFTSAMLFFSKIPYTKTKKLGFKNTLLIGLFQAIALLPGVSRSGMTISTGLIRGVKREEAAKFSFLLFIPAIIGATAFEFQNFVNITQVPELIVSFIVSTIVGLICLNFLLKIIKQNKFYKFGWYCLVLGLIVLLTTYI